MFNFSFKIFGHLIYFLSILIYGSIALISFNFARNKMPLYVTFMWTGLTTIFSITMWEYYINMTLYLLFLSYHISDPSGWLFDWQLWGLLAFLLIILVKYDFNIDWNIDIKVFILIGIMGFNILLWYLFPLITNPYSIFDSTVLTDTSIVIGTVHRFVGSLMFTVIFFGNSYANRKKNIYFRLVILAFIMILFFILIRNVRLLVWN